MAAEARYLTEHAGAQEPSEPDAYGVWQDKPGVWVDCFESHQNAETLMRLGADALPRACATAHSSPHLTVRNGRTAARRVLSSTYHSGAIMRFQRRTADSVCCGTCVRGQSRELSGVRNRRGFYFAGGVQLMGRGRKPKPRAVKIATGNPGHV